MTLSYEEPTLDQAERVLGIFYGRRNQWGGKLIITNRRILFAKLDLGPIPDILTFIGGAAGVPGIDVGKKVLDQIAGSVDTDISLQHITAVEPVGNAGLFGPPKIRVTTATAESVTADIVKTTTSVIWNKENNVIRDRAVALLRQAVSDAKSTV